MLIASSSSENMKSFVEELIYTFWYPSHFATHWTTFSSFVRQTEQVRHIEKQRQADAEKSVQAVEK